MFRVNNKDTRTTLLASFWYRYCLIWTYFTPYSSVSIVNFEQLNAGWETEVDDVDELFLRYDWPTKGV